jgi:hydrogenase expression/formation protein HypC
MIWSPRDEKARACRLCLALPAKIVNFPPNEPGVAVVDVLSVERRVNVDLLRDEDLAIGDWVLLHVGFAMSKVSEKDAHEQIELLMMLGETGEAQREIAL